MNMNYITKFVFGAIGMCLLVVSIVLGNTGMAMGAIACALFTNFIPSGERKVLPVPPEATPSADEEVKPKPVFTCKTCDKKFDTESKLQKHIGMAHWKEISV